MEFFQIINMKTGMNKRYICFLLYVLSFIASTSAQALQLPDGFVAEVVADSLNPIAMDIDHHGRIWLVEKHGLVRIIDDEGELHPDPFITLQVDDWNERGLLGIALHPDMDNKPFVYLYYTVLGSNFNRLSRFRANGDLAIPGSEEVLLETPELNGTIHNGGAMVFGNDGKLYLALGDGAKSNNGQDISTIFGKILRINEDGSIPEDNPFFDVFSGYQKAIWAIGVRNPFSMAKTDAGRIFFCDVGSSEYEEVNEVLPGKNYGWKLIEGPLQAGSLPPNEYMDPLYAYSHDEGCAIVGATVYEAEIELFPEEYHDKFFFADYCNGYIKYMKPEAGSLPDVFATGIDRPLALQVDKELGALYFLARAGLGGGSQIDNTSTNNGTLWRVFYTGNGSPFISTHPQDLLLPEGETAIFQTTAFGSQPINFQWQKDGTNIIGAVSPTLEIQEVQLIDNGAEIRCIVSNAEGADTSETATIFVTSNQRPLPVIDLPIAGSLFQAGEDILFSGHATDPEEGPLPPSALTWLIVWHHDEHTHPGLGPLSGSASGELTVPIVNETDPDVWYRIYLTATDSEGLSQTTFVEIFPELATVELDGTSGIPINIDGLVREQPHTFESLVGIQRTLQAPAIHVTEDSVYYFQNWSNGDSSSLQTFQMPENGLTLGAMYEALHLGQGSGLYGEYFNDPELDLDGTPVMTRVDSVIAYTWGAGSPTETIVPPDFFTVRWSGEVQAVFGETYTFYIKSDDGCRLWVGDSLLIDQWIPQAPTENSGSIVLESGQRYPIRIEYMEIAGGAEITLAWSSERTPKEIIPQRQLYPITGRSSVKGEVWFDENGNHFFDIGEIPLENVTSLLYSAPDTILEKVVTTEENGEFNFDFLPAGTYFLHFLSAPTGMALSPGTGLLDNGQTPLFELEESEHRYLNVSFQPLLNTDNTKVGVISGIRISPNPSSGHTTIEWETKTNDKVNFVLQNLAGQTIKTWQQDFPLGKHRRELDLRGLAKGIYFIRAISMGEAIVRKVLLR